MQHCDSEMPGQEEADAYFQQHYASLEQVLSAAINEACATCASNPLQSVARFLAEAASKAAMQEPLPASSSTGDIVTQATSEVQQTAHGWSVLAWAQSLSLHQAVAAALQAPASDDALAYCQSLSRSALEEKLRDARLDGHVKTVWQQLELLRGQGAATGRALNEKFAQEANFSMSYGGLGAPLPHLGRRHQPYHRPPKCLQISSTAVLRVSSARR